MAKNNQRLPWLIFFPHPGGEHLVESKKQGPGYQAIDLGHAENYMTDETRKDLAFEMVKQIRKDGNGTMWWNNGEHRRKFLKNNGRYVGLSEKPSQGELRFGEPKVGELLFWGEMEYPTHVCKIPYSHRDNTGKLPVFLHTPIPQERFPVEQRSDEELYQIYQAYIKTDSVEIPDANMGYQNTDPYVFGGKFLYSCCKQPAYKNILPELQTGDMIIFYSYKGKKDRSDFCCMIDTVFVVGEKIGTYQKGCYENIQRAVSEMQMQRIVLPVFYGSQNSIDGTEEFTLYRAATFEEREKFNGMFSYFPCRLFEDMQDCGFPRFELKNGKWQEGEYRLEKEPIPDMRNSQGIAHHEIASETAMKKAWLALTEQILKQQYFLGIQTDEPDFQ